MSDFEPKEPREKLSELATRVIEVASFASVVLLKYYRSTLDVSYKKDEFDPVTVADQESDALIRDRLKELFPNDLILSEENTEIPDSYDGRVWMVDPLDGTKDFVKGRDGFSINIGLLENGQIVFGCVVVPARGQVFFAEKGKGAFEKTKGGCRRMHVSTVEDVMKARLVTRNPSGETRPIEEKIDPMPFKERIPEGGIGTKLCLIASGNAEAHINTNFRASKWDTLGPQLILEEAGGMVTDFDGHTLDYKKPSVLWERSFVASNNSKIHSELLKVTA
ncbi:MAG: Ammonium transport protein [Candidatus Uhrbacteria bacterium GW2011_GWA2_52_8d]|uniref:Ammonium transport protein n=1 Tax=Candidatus Uhrbacteria bacterium GW2011_GWA2_52_8d TaxID=1618979 RepID=A0A0G1XP59_9BACT|nr:MAG: Ammonium transport protein [Candidatus Uhrbacteria bacterium GW2011_GWA2_52_8d]